MGNPSPVQSLFLTPIFLTTAPRWCRRKSRVGIVPGAHSVGHLHESDMSRAIAACLPLEPRSPELLVFTQPVRAALSSFCGRPVCAARPGDGTVPSQSRALHLHALLLGPPTLLKSRAEGATTLPKAGAKSKDEATGDARSAVVTQCLPLVCLTLLKSHAEGATALPKAGA